jgi:hypothetical protein
MKGPRRCFCIGNEPCRPHSPGDNDTSTPPRYYFSLFDLKLLEVLGHLRRRGRVYDRD